MTGAIIFASATCLLQFAAFYFAHIRTFHISVMVSLLIFDLTFPIYLFMTRDWYNQLIAQGDILTFGVWIHFMLVITLYVLYAVQVQVARAIVSGKEDAERVIALKKDHRAQGLGILITRPMMIFTGALLAPEVATTVVG
ncbi:MAG TPA: hypothetical protein ENJ13_00230 [Chromatiales bacterium]|nr:hypothetical protein [Chromatiales bacterium]